MPLITSLVAKLKNDFPTFRFAPSDEFRWSPGDATIFYDKTSGDAASLLHEVSHAILGHIDYSRDIELIELERNAWEYATGTLALTYTTSISDDDMQNSLDTYRDWLHARSTCPQCSATGVQIKKGEYKCLVCLTKWRVNDGRICALRRYRVT